MGHDGTNHGNDSQIGKPAPTPAMDNQQHAFGEVQGQMAGPAGAGAQNQMKDSMSAGSTASQFVPKVDFYDSGAAGSAAAGRSGSAPASDINAGSAESIRQNYMQRFPMQPSQDKLDQVKGKAGS